MDPIVKTVFRIEIIDSHTKQEITIEQAMDLPGLKRRQHLFVELLLVEGELQGNAPLRRQTHGHGQNEVAMSIPCGRMRRLDAHIKAGKP